MASTTSHLSAHPLEEEGYLSFMLQQQVIVSFLLFDSYLFISDLVNVQLLWLHFDCFYGFWAILITRR